MRRLRFSVRNAYEVLKHIMRKKTLRLHILATQHNNAVLVWLIGLLLPKRRELFACVLRLFVVAYE